ncbi:phage integrase [Shewanella baltica]|uniref:phage integrase n=1 Tax=Shewanella baltica TaxID=62322 RepID=UPI003D7AE547
MSIIKVDGGYRVDIRPSGRNGKRYRRTFDTKTEATKYEKFILSQHHNKDWLDAPIDRRPLLELIDLWFHFHGKNLKEGVNTRKNLISTCKLMGNPQSHQINTNFYLNYRARRLEKITPKTANLELTRLQGVYSVLIAAGEYAGEHPLKSAPPIKLQAKDQSFLTKPQIAQLLALLSGEMLLIVKICLSTGARWSEAQNLTSSQLLDDRINFINTKNGKNRTIPITREFRAELPNGNGRLFADCYHQFLAVLKSSGIELPKGQASHVLRHTFASHFVMNGGNILTLQKILGHGSIQMTMRYAHLAPDHLQEATRYNPLV